MAASATIAVPSMYFVAASVRRFRRASTTVDPREGATASELIVEGPNQWSRNPMYVGMAGMLLAHALGRRSVGSLFPAAVFLVWIDHLQIRGEEEHLRSRFGTEYETYAQRVRRWL